MSISTVSSNNGSKSSYEDLTQKVSHAEREATQRIADANKRVEQANLESNQTLNRLKDEYEKQTANEVLKHTNELDAERTKGYEQLRDLQRTQQAQLRTMRKEGERDISLLENHYRNEMRNLALNSEHAIQEQRNQTSRELAYEQNASEAQLSNLKQRNQLQIEQSQNYAQKRYDELVKTNAQQTDKMKLNADLSTERTRKHFEDQFNKAFTEGASNLDAIQSRASQQLNEIRKDTSEKLAAYRSRQTDPFYKLHTLDAQFYDNGENYVLTATIPEYEQEHISVAIKGDRLILSGYRKNEEDLKLGPGHEVGSASYQSFHESFPLTWPVESKALTREFLGDTLIVHVPKKNEFAYKTPTKATPERVRAEAPQYPNNIRHSKQDLSGDLQSATPKATPSSRGSGTLT